MLCRATILTAVAALIGARALAGGPAPERPDVLLIVIDDLNDWVGVLGGHPGVKTPAIDRLAARGTLFTRAHATAPLCNASRVSFLTGLRPSTTGIYDNRDDGRRLLVRRTTLPRHFAQHGYRVFGAGKIDHGSFPDDAAWGSYWPPQRFPNPRPGDERGLGRLSYGPLDGDETSFGDGQLALRVADVLQSPSSEPLFVAVGFVKPHYPWFVPRRYFDLYSSAFRAPPSRPDDLDDVPKPGRIRASANTDEPQLAKLGLRDEVARAYAAAVASVDAQVGYVLQALDSSPRASRTLVVLLSDNGFHLGQKSHWDKFTLWEESTRVPLIIAGPGSGLPGTQVHRVVSLLDIFPTLQELCGLPPVPGVEGRSLVPLLRDPERPWPYPAVTTHLKGSHAARSERWRYIRYAGGSEELYDHDSDPREWYNLADEPSLSAVKRELAAWLPAPELLRHPLFYQ